MKKHLLPVILLALCAILTLSACTMIKEPANLKDELEQKGYTVRHYTTVNGKQFQAMLNLIELSDGSGVTDIIIADGGNDKTDAKPLIIFYCNSREATEKVFTAAKKSLDAVAKFTNMASPDECNLMTEDNTVIMGVPEMIAIAMQ